MKRLAAILSGMICFLAACSQKPKEFSNVTTGMSRNDVYQNAGEPSRKKDIGVAELWIYNDADRMVVFRNDTVYDVLTSSEARIDSIEMSLKTTGQKINNTAKEVGDKIDSLGKKVKDKLSKDSLK